MRCTSVPRHVTIHRYLQLLQIWALFGHHCSQELVLKSISGDQEVDEGTLGLHRGLIVRVEVLGVQDQAEAGVVLHLLVTDLNVPGREHRHREIKGQGHLYRLVAIPRAATLEPHPGCWTNSATPFGLGCGRLKAACVLSPRGPAGICSGAHAPGFQGS